MEQSKQSNQSKNRFNRIVWFFLLAPAVIYAQDPDLQIEPIESIEEVFRSSEQDGAVPTNRRQREGKTRRVSVPPGAFRIGCICMDDTRSDVRSIGACSGHGGVRFWVYRTREGDTVHILTGRHERHPQPLNAAEMSELSQKRADRTQTLRQGNSLQPAAPVVIVPTDQDGFDWPDATVVSAAGLALFFIVRMILRWLRDNEHLVKYALRHLLRHRKRPPSRPRRKDPGEKRLP
jgi:hypothetical protein